MTASHQAEGLQYASSEIAKPTETFPVFEVRPKKKPAALHQFT
jgi:hypothetical protein